MALTDLAEQLARADYITEVREQLSEDAAAARERLRQRLAEQPQQQQQQTLPPVRDPIVARRMRPIRNAAYSVLTALRVRAAELTDPKRAAGYGLTSVGLRPPSVTPFPAPFSS
jgi:hypothetical protein